MIHTGFRTWLVVLSSLLCAVHAQLDSEGSPASLFFCNGITAGSKAQLRIQGLESDLVGFRECTILKGLVTEFSPTIELYEYQSEASIILRTRLTLLALDDHPQNNIMVAHYDAGTWDLLPIIGLGDIARGFTRFYFIHNFFQTLSLQYEFQIDLAFNSEEPDWTIVSPALGYLQYSYVDVAVGTGTFQLNVLENGEVMYEGVANEPRYDLGGRAALLMLSGSEVDQVTYPVDIWFASDLAPGSLHVPSFSVALLLLLLFSTN